MHLAGLAGRGHGRDNFMGGNPPKRFLVAAVYMIWLYERGPDVLRIETRFDNASSEFELVWHRPDGSSESERFPTEAAFKARLDAVEASLRTEQWNITGAPQVLPDGWRNGGPKPAKLN